MVFPGTSPDNVLAEMIELPESMHPFFIASQFHPEFKSRPERPHPLFHGFVTTALALQDGVEPVLTAVGMDGDGVETGASVQAVAADRVGDVESETAPAT